jgi:hypothetical protein
MPIGCNTYVVVDNSPNKLKKIAILKEIKLFLQPELTIFDV